MRCAMLLLLLVPAGVSRGDEATAGKLELIVEETAGIRRFGYPVYVALPLPRDPSVKDRFRLKSGGKPVAAQFRLLSGAKRKVALDFNVSLGPLEKKQWVDIRLK